ncbi:hypothetical protein MKW94_000299, partial [Papaver nudicaule]|nr:hypothetical protein [Papaver nudicaule]
MRIRKLIAQKKISATISPSPSSNTPSLISATISSAPAGAVTTTVSTQEREKILEEPQLDVCELNMSPWDLISAEDLVYYYPGEDFKLKEESEDYGDGKVTDDSVNADEDQI